MLTIKNKDNFLPYFYGCFVETAPIKFSNVSQLLKNNHFVYDLTIERNVEYTYYKEYIQQMKKLELLLDSLKPYYLHQHDFYGTDGLAICALNELMYFVKAKFNSKYYRLFEKAMSPYGYWDHYKFKYGSIEEILKTAADRKFKLIDYQSSSEKEYVLPKSCPCSKEMSSLDKLLHIFMTLAVSLDPILKYVDHPNNFNDKKLKPVKKIYPEGNNVVEPEDQNYNVGQ